MPMLVISGAHLIDKFLVMPQFYHLYNKDAVSTYFKVLAW